MNAPAAGFVPMRRVQWSARVAASLVAVAKAPWFEGVTASSEDRAAVVAVIHAEAFAPGMVREDVVVQVRRAGVVTSWAVSCAGEGYAAYSLDEESADTEESDHAEDSDPGEESDHGGAGHNEDAEAEPDGEPEPHQQGEAHQWDTERTEASPC